MAALKFPHLASRGDDVGVGLAIGINACATIFVMEIGREGTKRGSKERFVLPGLCCSPTIDFLKQRGICDRILGNAAYQSLLDRSRSFIAPDKLRPCDLKDCLFNLLAIRLRDERFLVSSLEDLPHIHSDFWSGDELRVE